jgi:hypothetical protein
MFVNLLNGTNNVNYDMRFGISGNPLPPALSLLAQKDSWRINLDKLETLTEPQIQASEVIIHEGNVCIAHLVRSENNVFNLTLVRDFHYYDDAYEACYDMGSTQLTYRRDVNQDPLWEDAVRDVCRRLNEGEITRSDKPIYERRENYIIGIVFGMGLSGIHVNKVMITDVKGDHCSYCLFTQLRDKFLFENYRRRYFSFFH